MVISPAGMRTGVGAGCDWPSRPALGTPRISSRRDKVSRRLGPLWQRQRQRENRTQGFGQGEARSRWQGAAMIVCVRAAIGPTGPDVGFGLFWATGASGH